jgi:hypothetical protein
VDDDVEFAGKKVAIGRSFRINYYVGENNSPSLFGYYCTAPWMSVKEIEQSKKEVSER